MLVRSLQNLLADFYGLEIGADVTDYLVTDPRLLQLLQADSQPSPDETLFIGTHDHINAFFKTLRNVVVINVEVMKVP